MNIHKFPISSGFLVVLAACTIQGEISNAGVQEVQVIGEHLRAVVGQRFTNSSYREKQSSEDGYFLVQLVSSTNLERIIHDREMASLYYELQPCDQSEQSRELLSGPVFVDTNAGLPVFNEFNYFAPVPRDIVGQIGRYQELMGNHNVVFPSSICIRLAAGNMAGLALKTNLVPLGVDFSSEK